MTYESLSSYSHPSRASYRLCQSCADLLFIFKQRLLETLTRRLGGNECLVLPSIKLIPSDQNEKKRLYESVFRLGVIPGGRFEEHQRNIIERGLDMCRLGLARPDIDQQTKERLKEEQELIELLLSLNFIAKPESWLEDPDDALITLAIQLSEVISRDREVNRLFRNAWLKTMGTTIDTYDAHMPYIMENPKGARYKQGKFEIDGSGVVRLNEGEEHRIVTGFDVNDYRRFLRKRLTFDSTRKGMREIERRLRRAW